jgi:hypothetical protein
MKAELDESRIRARGEAPVELVFDFAGMRSPDLGALCLMLTARMLAEGTQRRVWLHALPEPTWRLLHTLGLEHFFEHLPQSGEMVN